MSRIRSRPEESPRHRPDNRWHGLLGLRFLFLSKRWESYLQCVYSVDSVDTMAKPIASARIPHSWDDQIKAIAAETGKTSSEIVKEAIGQYLGKTDPESIASMARRLSKLEQKYKKLAQLV